MVFSTNQLSTILDSSETFDVIIIDECHRSIYNLRACLITSIFYVGLTATPSPYTLGFLKIKTWSSYTHDQAVVNKVKVSYDIIGSYKAW